MFTGITTHFGKIKKISKEKNSDYYITTKLNLKDTKIGSSISCSGICLTVTKKLKNTFIVNISEETLKITSARSWKVGTIINLEKSLKIGDELGGHLVTGHVDDVGTVKSVKKLEKSNLLYFSYPGKFKKLICKKGSITIDGVSLTVNKVNSSFFTVNLIAHTQKKTTLGKLKKGDKVNLEIDILSRYIDRNINTK